MKKNDLAESLLAGRLPKDAYQDVVAAALSQACSEWARQLRDPYMDGVDGAPPWKEFEHKIWQLGEALRAAMKKRSGWMLPGPLAKTIERISRDTKYGRGRQSFVLLLGCYGVEYTKTLVELLADEVVCGHAAKAMVAGKIWGYDAEVRRLERDPRAWIRATAKRYAKASKGRRETRRVLKRV